MGCLDMKDKRGVVIIIVAIVLVVLLGMAALAIDLGQLYVARQKAQNTCDAAAIAGMMRLAVLNEDLGTRMAAASARAQETAAGNNEVTNWRTLVPGTDEYGIEVTFPTTVTADDGTIYAVEPGNAIRTEAEILVNYGFARIFGQTSRRVKASATAVVETSRGVCADMIPIVVSDLLILGTPDNPDPINFGDQYVLHEPSWKEGFLGPGNYLSIRLGDDSGAADYRARLAGNKDIVCLGTEPPTMLDTEPGFMGNPTYRGIKARLAKETVYTNDQTAWTDWLSGYNPETGKFPSTWRTVVVPIIKDNPEAVNGQKPVEVVGFAGFFIEWVDRNGDIYGRFIQGVANGDTIQWLFPTGEATQVQTLKSVRLIS